MEDRFLLYQYKRIKEAKNKHIPNGGIMKKAIIMLFLLLLAGLVFAQQDPLYFENFGFGKGDGAVEYSIGNYQGYFRESGVTYEGPGNTVVSNSDPWTDTTYPGISGPYSIQLKGQESELYVKGINTLGHENIKLGFGLYKTQISPAHLFSVEVRDVNEVPETWHTIFHTSYLNYNESTDNIAGWQYFEISDPDHPIPSTDNLWIRFKNLNGIWYLLDDIKLSGDENGGGDPPVPVELSSFTATISAHNYVTLTWVTQTETGMRGYYVFRAPANDLANAQIVSPMIESVNSSQQQTYIYEDRELYESGTYYYWLQANDLDGSSAFHGPVSIMYSTMEDQSTPEIPLVTKLHNAYPNPFNPTVFIPFSLAHDGAVSFKIYNSRGQMVKHFDLGAKTAGHHRVTWDGTDYDGKALANGVYQIMMSTQNQVYQSKATLLK